MLGKSSDGSALTSLRLSVPAVRVATGTTGAPDMVQKEMTQKYIIAFIYNIISIHLFKSTFFWKRDADIRHYLLRHRHHRYRISAVLRTDWSSHL